MNTDTYHYLANKTHRDDLMRQANRRRLISKAERYTTPRAVAAALFALFQTLFR